MPKIVTVEQMRAIEQASDKQGHSYSAMMEMAGGAVAVRIQELLAGQPDPHIAVLVGPGNNGGDGLVAARILSQELDGANVSAFLLAERDDSDPVFAAARDARVSMTVATGSPTASFRALQTLVNDADVVVDALFGTSLRLPIKGDAAKVLQTVTKVIVTRRANRRRSWNIAPASPVDEWVVKRPFVVAVDCPSGLDCATGELDPLTLHADETITFAAAKPGLLTFPGARAVGLLHVADIGLPEDLPELDAVPLTLVDAATTGQLLPDRLMDSHKGTFGKAMVVAGSLNYTGAAYLAAHAAYRVGGGLVTVAAPQIIIPTLAGMLPEATWLLLPHDLGVINEAAVKVLRKEIDGYSALLLGPGLGRESVTGDFLRELLQPKEEIRRSRAIGFVPAAPGEAEGEADAHLPPCVIDADGLNLLANWEDWPALVPPGTILTPHPGEFARLSGLDLSEVQANRLELAQAKAAEWGCVLVLKGAFTVVAAPEGRTAVLPFATAALASAGTGDVLAGAIVGLLAQGLAPFAAAVAGAWLHGMAGMRAAELLNTTASVMAGDVLDLLPDAYALAERAGQ